MSANQWLKAIASASQSRIDKVPKGWFTRDQISQKIKKGSTSTRDYIRKLLQQGKAERQDFYIYIKARKTSTPIPHYKIKCTN